MKKTERQFLLVLFVFVVCLFAVFGFSLVSASFEFNGTVYDINGTALNATNITVLIKDASSWSSIVFGSVNKPFSMQ